MPWVRRVAAVAVLAGSVGIVVPVAVAGAATLTNASWWPSSTKTSATSVSYTYTFVTASGGNLTSISVTVPSGTGGSPTVSTMTSWGGTRTKPTVTSSTPPITATKITIPLSGTFIGSNKYISFKIGGLTNTATATAVASSGFAPTVSTSTSGGTLDSATANPVVFTSTTLTSPFWSASSTKDGATTGVSYTYSVTTATTATLTTLSMTVPPGTSGTPSVSSVRPATLAGGTISLTGTVLKYTFGTKAVTSGTRISITVGGLHNTSFATTYSEVVATGSSGAWVNSMTTPSLTFTAGALTSISVSASSPTAGKTNVAYTYNFKSTSYTINNVTSITLGVPPGTGGTPALGTVTATPSYRRPTLQVAWGASTKLVLTKVGGGTFYLATTVLSIQITGLTNTTVGGTYALPIAMFDSAANTPMIASGAPATPIPISSLFLSSLSWSASSTKVSQTGVTYTFAFKLSATSTLTSISMSVPPGTGGTPTFVSASPASITGGTTTHTFSATGGSITYTFSATTVSKTTTVQLVFSGLTNTSTANTYASTIVVSNGGLRLTSGSTPSITFTSALLTSVSWSASSTSAGATGVTYTYAFTTATSKSLTSVTITVPAGTTVHSTTPGIGRVTENTLTFPSVSASLSFTVVTVTFTTRFIPAGTVFSIQLTGFTNTPTAGSYSASITTRTSTPGGSPTVDSGTTPALSFTSSVLGTPTWTVRSTAVGATTTYTYAFTVKSVTTLTTITMSVPAGLGGTPSISSVTPASVAGGTLTLSGTTFTYTFSSATLAATTRITIKIANVRNPTSGVTFTSTITTKHGGTAIASGSPAPVTFTATVLTTVTWAVSSTHTLATGVTYTFTLKTSSTTTLTSITMTVPTGTAGTPVLASITETTVAVTGGHLAWTGTTTLKYSFSGSTHVPGGKKFVITVHGMTNTTTPGSYTSVMATKRTGVVDSGTSAAVTMVGGTFPSATWSASNTVGGGSTSYTYTFKTASTSTLTKVTMSVPAGTSGTVTVGTVTPAAVAAGGHVALSGTLLTYTFTAASIAPTTTVSIQVNGLLNTSTAGTYTSTVKTYHGSTVIDQGTTNGVTITVVIPTAPTAAFTKACGTSTPACTAGASGATRITLVAIPGLTKTARVALSVASNLPHGYRVRVQSSPFTRAGGGGSLPQATPTGTSTQPTNAFYAGATLSAASGSGAALCAPYSTKPYVGYRSTARSLWTATAGTGPGSDTVTITEGIKVSATQPAGTYTATIAYTVDPTSSSC